VTTTQSGLFGTLLALAVLVPSDVWVYLDARRRAAAGRPVQFATGSLQVQEPEQWLALCALLFAVFFPAYLVSRRQ